MPPSSLRKCRSCSVYTLKDTCPKCGGPTRTPHPARFSPADPYARYRRALHEQIRMKG